MNSSENLSPVDKLVGVPPPGSLTLIYGEAGTGKSFICNRFAYFFAKKNQKVIYVDTDGSLTIRRILPLVKLRREADVLPNIVVFMPKSFEEQSLLIESLWYYISNNTSLIVIDSLTSLYRTELPNRGPFRLTKELNNQLALLSELAKLRNLRVLLTSQVYTHISDSFSQIEMLGSRILRHWCDLIIKLEHMPELRLKKAWLEKEFGNTPFKSCIFNIADIM